MNSDVCKIKKYEQCGFNFVQTGKSSKDMIFFFASLKKLKHELNFLLAQRSPKIMKIIFSSLKRLKNYEDNFL